MVETMRLINRIVVHCSATYPEMLPEVNAARIRRWHTDPPPLGRGWIDIGYHRVVLPSGTIELGRDPDHDGITVEHQGAHVYGWNANTLAVCWIGGINTRHQITDNLTPAAREALLLVCWGWMWRFSLSPEDVVGHNEFPGVAKACPVIDMDQLRQQLAGGGQW
jgi:hypothetical protein